MSKGDKKHKMLLGMGAIALEDIHRDTELKATLLKNIFQDFSFTVPTDNMAANQRIC
ncbi:MAG: hypothetical protein AAGD25_14825 [Cyanobacteria bacterium P01_F01_bin.150]